MQKIKPEPRAKIRQTIASSLLILAASAGAAPAAFAQGRPDDPNAGDVAMTPLTDLNITSKNIPEILLRAALDPYLLDGLPTCNSLRREVMRLDAVLGDDFDTFAEEKSGLNINIGRTAQGAVGEFIPFRGVVRELTGAAGKDRDMQTAITGGMVRRGFLKGVGLERGCDLPARPREPAEQVTVDEAEQSEGE
ncbi:MAG: hypothetical protein ACXIT4_09010 [Erythrobacter sp.]